MMPTPPTQAVETRQNSMPLGRLSISESMEAPVVVNPDGCVDHCHGCGNLCPQGAITYVGDDTGWTPPNGKHEPSTGCCCG